MPGVRSGRVRVSAAAPGRRDVGVVRHRGRRAAPPDRPHCDIAIVAPGFFRTMGIAILGAATFTDRDTTEAPRVLVVNEGVREVSHSRAKTSSASAWSRARTNGNEENVLREIVGVVGDAEAAGSERGPGPRSITSPDKQMTWGIGTIVHEDQRAAAAGRVRRACRAGGAGSAGADVAASGRATSARRLPSRSRGS